MVWFMGVVAFLGGVLNTVQSGSNATLAKSMSQPMLAAIIVSVTNVALYLAVSPFVGLGMPKVGSLGAIPWWAWLGGLFGGSYVLASIFFAEKLGAAVFIGVTVTAGIITSVVMDHFGLVGFRQHALGIGRLIGCAVMLGGLALICIF